MRESPQETLSRLGPYPRYPDFCTIQVDQRNVGSYALGQSKQNKAKEATAVESREKE